MTVQELIEKKNLAINQINDIIRKLQEETLCNLEISTYKYPTLGAVEIVKVEINLVM